MHSRKGNSDYASYRLFRSQERLLVLASEFCKLAFFFQQNNYTPDTFFKDKISNLTTKHLLNLYKSVLCVQKKKTFLYRLMFRCHFSKQVLNFGNQRGLLNIEFQYWVSMTSCVRTQEREGEGREREIQRVREREGEGERKGGGGEYNIKIKMPSLLYRHS